MNESQLKTRCLSPRMMKLLCVCVCVCVCRKKIVCSYGDVEKD